MKSKRIIAALILAVLSLSFTCPVYSQEKPSEIEIKTELLDKEVTEVPVLIINTEANITTAETPQVSRVTRCRVHLHQSPSTENHEGMLTYDRGVKLEGSLDNKTNWFRTEVNGIDYYIYSDFLVTEEEWEVLSKIPYSNDVPLSEDLQKYLWNECQDIGMKYCFALALIDQETGGTFRSDLVSRTNDWGITQINKCNHKRYIEKGWITCSQDLLNPYNGIHCGLDFMNQYVQQYGCVERAYAQYNTGKPIKSNKNSRSFMKKYEKWKSLLGDI